MLMKVSSGIKCSVLSVNINSVPMFLLQCWWWEVEDDQVVGLVAGLMAMMVLVMATKRKQNFQ